tara:strand:- start:155 stop:403 length:249 start_codon:yes stop_codon:yes gene_type:complete
MPVYCYECRDCRKVFEVRHGMFFEEQRCVSCFSEDVFRKPSLNQKSVSHKSTEKTGKVVDKYIEDAKSEIKKEKQRLKSEEL